MTMTREWQHCFQQLQDPSVSEIEVNGPNLFFIKKAGKRLQLNISLDSEEEYLTGIETSLIPQVRDVVAYERNSYLFEGPLYYRTPQGEIIRGRCHIVLPPATDSPQVTIAKKSTSLTSLEAIAGRGSMSLEMLQFIKAAIHANLTIAFSGGTGAGKTTMLEACSKLIPDSVRIGVAEDTPELALTQPNVTYLHSVPWKPGMDPNKVATLSWVVQQFQRMRTDRLIIGETRGKEFADFLVAANSGMEGSMTTIHANTPVRCLDKMTNFALKGADGQPIRAINTDIGNAIDLIIQLIILPDGRHKVDAIQEITSVISNNEDARITTNPLYTYNAGQDKFIKKSFPTDDLRKRLLEKNVRLEEFLKTAPGQILSPHNSSAGDPSLRTQQQATGLPTAGLPRREV